MADAEKKQKKSKIAEALGASLDIIAPEVEDGTILRFDVVIDNVDEKGGENTYTYAALYVGDKWWVTGQGRLLNQAYDSTLAFLTAVAKWKVRDIQIATKFESIR
jgi:hypothetical protein